MKSEVGKPGGSAAAPRREFVWCVETGGGDRLDRWLSARSEISSRSYAQTLIEDGLVKVNGRHPSKGDRVKPGDEVTVVLPPPRPVGLLPEEIPLVIVYEDSDLIVLSKPAGMVVHPGHGAYKATLVHALLAHTRDLSGIGGVERPGIVHRLDKDTSGLLVVAKNDMAHIALSKDIKARTVDRRYLALVHGAMPSASGTIEAPIGRSFRVATRMSVAGRGSREAVTHWKVMRQYDGYELVEARLGTGRTHQIRVHFAYVGHPVVGDPVYGEKSVARQLGLGRQFLHAYKLNFTHPRTGEAMSFSDALPLDLEAVLASLAGGPQE